MRRISALLVLGLVVVTTVGWTASSFEVGFALGASQTAGAESELVFTLPAPAGQRYFEIDLSGSGFATRATATVTAEGWPNRQAVAATVTERAGVLSVVLAEETTAWNLYVNVPVHNPAKAQSVLGTAFKVRSGKDAALLEPRTTQASALVIRYDVRPAASFLPVGGYGPVEFEVRESGKLVTEELGFRLRWNKTVVLNGTTKNGKVTANLGYALEKNRHAGVVTLDVWNVKTPAIVGSGVVPIRYNFAISGTDGLKIGDDAVISGRVTDANGAGVAGVAVSLTTAGFAGSAGSSTRTDVRGGFALTVRFTTADRFSVRVGEATYHTFIVTGGSMEVKVQPKELVSSSADMRVEVSSHHDGTTLAGVEYRVEGPGGALVKDWEKSGSWGNTVTVLNIGKSLPAGTYKVLARWDENMWATGETIYDRFGEATFSVRASKVEVEVLRVDSAGKVLVGANWVQVKVTDVKGAGVKEKPEPEQVGRVYFEIKGPLRETVTFDSAVTGAIFDDEGKTTRTSHIQVQQWGKLTVAGHVEFGNGRIETFSHTAEADGWLVETKQVLGTYGQIVELRAMVKTSAGEPVNSAVVTWQAAGEAFSQRRPDGTWGPPTNTVRVDGVLSNVNDGVYLQEVRLVRAEENVDVVVTQWGGTQARAAFEARVAGRQDYKLTVTAPELRATLANQAIRIAVTDTTGALVTNLDGLQVTGCGVAITLANSHLVDSDGDGRSDAYMVYVSPSVAGELAIRVGRHNYSLYGEASLWVMQPRAIMEPAKGVITADIWDRVVVRGTDATVGGLPRALRVRLTPVNVGMTLRNPAVGVVPPGEMREPVTLWASEVQTVEIRARVLAGEKPQVKVSVSYSGEHWLEIGALVVMPMQVLLEPDELLFGVRTLVRVDVRDARGEPLAGRAVEFAGAAAQTGLDGGANIYVATQVTGSLPLTIATDNPGVSFIRQVASILDREPPQLDLAIPPLVWGDRVMIKGSFGDNHKVSRVFIEGIAEIPIVPEAGWFEYELALRQGANNFAVIAVDATGNVTRRPVRVVAAAQLVLRLGQIYPELGLNEPLQQVGGRIMVPLRWFAEQVLGGRASYTVFDGYEVYGLTYGETFIEFVPGSGTAFVNGRSVTTDPCFVSQGRLYVPLRFVAEHVGLEVMWDSVIQSVIIRP